ncbi:TNF receptor-associated factor 2 [Paragonimus westermani]|uniref:TNF receptor-associated factor 2 n=1 Tax=Paragonimus westermani TaxID=34504 RepID=A0A8T0DHL5_9TREM|nr:TNF receptor-associated factor 2 [Paragonimus westermani]
MGLLAEHFSHEHRRYSAYELDLLLSSSYKVASKSIEKSSQREPVMHKPTEDHMETPEPAPSAVTLSINVSTNPAIGTLPSTCQSLATSLEESEVMESEHQAMPQGLTHLRRDSRPSRIRTHRSASRRSTASTSGNTTLTQTPRTNIFTPATRSRLSQRQSPSTHFVVPPLMRPPVGVRTSRTGTTGSTQQTDSGHRSTGSQQVRRHVRTQPRQSRSPVATDHPPLDGASETGDARDTQSSTSRSPLPQSESRLLPFRTTPSSISHNVALDCELDQRVSSPPPIILTTSPASATYVAARNQMYDSRHTEVSPRTGENQIDNESDHITPISRSGNFSLPAINRNTTLTTQIVTRSYYDGVPSNENQTNDVDPDDHVDQSINARPREPRPLEFRRLVPRRQNRVVEQLRETREQLAAMLRLMTLELEERRQHVLAATLETASSSRLLRSLNSQITAHQEVRHQDNVRPIQETSENDSEYNLSESRDRQNHNLHDTLNVLRNLPTPERPAQLSSSQRTLQHLTNRMLGERIHRTEVPSDAVSHSFRYRLDGSQQQTDEVENPAASPGAAMRTFGSSNPRLLARVRVDSTVSPVLFVAGRRNLDHLLSGLRYPSATATEWSSDEDDSGDDDDPHT